MINKLEQIKQLIEANDKIVIFHHKLPDGDAISSSYALAESISRVYPEKKIAWIADREYLEKRFPYMPFDFEKFNFESEVDSSWLGILGDCNDAGRTWKGEIYAELEHKIMFDHHRNDQVTPTDVFYHQPTYIASAMQSFEIAKHLGVKFDEQLAIWHYFGIMTDSNRFAFSMAEQLPLQYAIELFEYISNEAMSDLLRGMQTRTQKALKFEGWVLNNFKIEEKVAYLKIDKKDQEALGLQPDDAARVNMIGNIEGVEAWLFFIEYPDFIRVEFRSLGTPVNEVAKTFNGGGHIRASGCHLEVMEDHTKVLKATQEAVVEFLNK